MSQFLNTPTVKVVAQKVVDVLDFVPDDFLANIGGYLHKYFGGEIFYDPFEKALVSTAPEFWANTRKYYKDNTHPLLKGFCLTDPVELVFWLCFYLVAIVVIGVAGKYIAYPGKLEVKNLSLIHNAVLCLMSLWMGVLTLANALSEPDYSIVDLPVTKRLSFAKICWIFATISKIQEFMDTFIMMMKQNYRQVSFLHVYHHLSILAFCVHFCIYTYQIEFSLLQSLQIISNAPTPSTQPLLSTYSSVLAKRMSLPTQKQMPRVVSLRSRNLCANWKKENC